MNLYELVPPCMGLVAAPLLIGVINRVKAWFSGRTGPPLTQPYRDITKLLRKGAVYSDVTTWVFRASPVIGLAAAMVALFFVPLGGVRAPFAFEGDLFLVALVLGLGRFFVVVAALDTGSPFEGMGASREVQIASLTEPAVLLSLAVLARASSGLSLSTIFASLEPAQAGPALVLVSIALFVVLLAECSRIPVDDPNTHLELTMIHEVMVLDHGGPDLGFITYGAALKMWILAAIVVGTLLPVHTGLPALDFAIGLAGVFIIAIAIGVVESSMARLRLRRLPQLLASGTVLAAVALVLVLE